MKKEDIARIINEIMYTIIDIKELHKENRENKEAVFCKALDKKESQDLFNTLGQLENEILMSIPSFKKAYKELYETD